jgi:nitrite reductase (NADH) small subunit
MEIKAELGPDGRGVVTTTEGAIAVLRVEGRLYAVANACPHAGNPLVEGDVLGRTLVCAFHGWRFDLETGACLLGDEPARTYAVEERDGEIWVDVP